MKEVSKGGVLIDTCTQCRGVWLDRGELAPREELRNYCGGMILEGLNVFDIAGFGFVDKGFLAN